MSGESDSNKICYLNFHGLKCTNATKLHSRNVVHLLCTESSSSAVLGQSDQQGSCSANSRPADHNQPAYLAKYNLQYRKEYGLLVCCPCSAALGRSFATHLNAKHGISVVAKDRKQILVQCFANESSYFLSNQVPLPALDFVPILDGFKCAQCNHYFLKESSARKHAQNSHVNISIVPCKVQTLCSDSAACRTYFGVESQEQGGCESSTAGSSSLNIASVVEKTMQLAFHSGATLPTDSVREANLFYITMDWAKKPGEEQDRLSTVLKHTLLHIPGEGEEHYVMAQQIHEIFLNSLKNVSSFGFQLRININVDIKGSRGPKTFTPPLTCLETNGSRQEYARLLTSLMVFANNMSNHHPDLLQHSDTVESVKATFTTPTRSNVFGTMCAFLREYTPTNSKSQATIPLFVRCCCQLKDGRLLQLDGVSRICGKLIYMAKVSILEAVMDREERSRVAAMDELKPLVEVDNYNVFSFLCRVQALARRVLASSNRMPCVLSGLCVGQQDPWKVIVGGITLSLDSLQAAYHKSLAKCQTAMQTLLLGAEGIQISSINDNLVSSPHIMAHKDSLVDHDCRCSLLRHILDNEGLKARFVSAINADNVVQYSSKEAQRYLEDWDDYIENMLLVIHLGSGLPARATELETLRIVGGESAKRSIFFVDGLVMLLTEYNKTRSMTKANKAIARFLDEKATMVLLNDLLIVRPFVCSITSFLSTNDNNVYGTHLFVHRGEKMEAPRIRNVFSTKFKEHGGHSISFGEYRHLAKHYALKLKINFAWQDEEDEEAGQDEEHRDWETLQCEQFGHSKTTANTWYALLNGELSTMRHHLIQDHRWVSVKWHQFLNCTSPVCKKRNLAVDTVSSRPDIGETLRSQDMAVGCTPLPTNTMEQTSIMQKPSLSSNTHHDTFVNVRDSETSLSLLRSFLGDQQATFKSVVQRAAVDSILHTTSDVLAVLPTGGGKSLLFFLYAARHPCITSIVIVPTVSLMADMARRARSQGISCSEDASSVTDENLVLVTPEGAESRQFWNLIIQLHASNRLGVLFIDEAHVFSTECDYRPSVRRLTALASFPKARFVLLTATCPQWIAEDILSNFFGPNRWPVVIRDSTYRLNIRYEVNRSGMSVCEFAKRTAVAVKNYRDSDRAIVYVPSLELLEGIHQAFLLAEIPCAAYSGRLSRSDNQDSFLRWREGEARVMVATSAFGLGIDYPMVRTVVCYGLPYSMEEWVQQTGRAGRDGAPSCALLFFDPRKEQQKLEAFQEDKAKRHFQQMLSFATMPDVCLRRIISRYMDSTEIECSYLSCEPCGVCSEYSEKLAANSYKAGRLAEEADWFDGLDEEILQDLSYGQSVLESYRDLGQQLLYYLTRYKKECIVCYVAKNLKICHPRACNIMYNLCYRCFSDEHKWSDCLRSPRNINKTCPHCFLPDRLGEVVFHPYSFMKDCEFKDILKLFGLAAIKFKKISDEEWLYSRDVHGNLNLWIFFVKYLSKQ